MKVTYLQAIPTRSGEIVHIPQLEDGERAIEVRYGWWYERHGDDLDYNEGSSFSGSIKNYFTEERLREASHYYRAEIQ
jgi:hypothetical protein